MRIVYAIAGLGLAAFVAMCLWIAARCMTSTFGPVWGIVLLGVAGCMAIAFVFGGMKPDNGRTDR